MDWIASRHVSFIIYLLLCVVIPTRLLVAARIIYIPTRLRLNMAEATAVPPQEVVELELGPGAVLLDMQDLLMLSHMPFSRVVGVFARHSAKDKTISGASFHAALKDIWQLTKVLLAKANASFEEEEVLSELAELAPQLYAIFDTDGDGCVSASELSAGLTALCAGEPRDKAVTLFKLFDSDSSATITPQEMECFVTAILRTQRALAGPPPAGVDVPPVEALAKETTRACFADADVNGDGTLTLDEYLAWYLADSKTLD